MLTVHKLCSLVPLRRDPRCSGEKPQFPRGLELLINVHVWTSASISGYIHCDDYLRVSVPILRILYSSNAAEASAKARVNKSTKGLTVPSLCLYTLWVYHDVHLKRCILE